MVSVKIRNQHVGIITALATAFFTASLWLVAPEMASTCGVLAVRIRCADFLFEAGGEFHGLDRARRQFDIGNMVIFEADVDHQLIGVIVDGLKTSPV